MNTFRLSHLNMILLSIKNSIVFLILHVSKKSDSIIQLHDQGFTKQNIPGPSYSWRYITKLIRAALLSNYIFTVSHFYFPDFFIWKFEFFLWVSWGNRVGNRMLTYWASFVKIQLSVIVVNMEGPCASLITVCLFIA